MSLDTKEFFKQQLLQKRYQSRKKLKVKKFVWLNPSAYERQYKKIIKTFIQKYIAITESLFPLIENWNKEQKEIKDTWNEELEEINEEEYEKVYTEEKSHLKAVLLNMVIFVSSFNRNQFNKITEQQFGFEGASVYEKWERDFLDLWVNRNVNLIKGLADEYRKKIVETIINGVSKDKITSAELKQKLKEINTSFSENRTTLIARDQISKINNQLAEQRQKDAGIDTYFWRNSQDERVVGNPTGLYPKGNETHGNHWIMEGLLCRWDDDTVYSDDNGQTWKKRTSEMPKAKPGDEPNCRCFAEPNFNRIVEEVNNEKI